MLGVCVCSHACNGERVKWRNCVCSVTVLCYSELYRSNHKPVSTYAYEKNAPFLCGIFFCILFDSILFVLAGFWFSCAMFKRTVRVCSTRNDRAKGKNRQKKIKGMTK